MPTIIPRLPQPVLATQVSKKTAAYTVKTRDNGAFFAFDSTTAFTITLPKAQKGLYFTFFIKQVASATGHVVAVPTGVVMYGKVSPTGAATAATAGKGRVNTQATSAVGDALDVWCDGTNWFATPIGTWAEN